MVVRLRLARHGTRNNPFYHIVAIADHKPRDALPIEKLGEYDPIPRRVPVYARAPPALAASAAVRQAGPSSPIGPQGVMTSGLASEYRMEKRIEWNSNRIQYWLQTGAQPTKTVAKLLDKAGLIPEGKFYKGMFRHPEDAPPPRPGLVKLTPSEIAEAAEASSGSRSSSYGSASASTVGLESQSTQSALEALPPAMLEALENATRGSASTPKVSYKAPGKISRAALAAQVTRRGRGQTSISRRGSTSRPKSK